MATNKRNQRIVLFAAIAVAILALMNARTGLQSMGWGTTKSVCESQRQGDLNQGYYVTDCTYVGQSAADCAQYLTDSDVGDYTYFFDRDGIPSGLNPGEREAYNCLGQPSVQSPNGGGNGGGDCDSGEYKCVNSGNNAEIYGCSNGEWSTSLGFTCVGEQCTTTSVRTYSSLSAAIDALCEALGPLDCTVIGQFKCFPGGYIKKCIGGEWIYLAGNPRCSDNQCKQDGQTSNAAYEKDALDELCNQGSGSGCSNPTADSSQYHCNNGIIYACAIHTWSQVASCSSGECKYSVSHVDDSYSQLCAVGGTNGNGNGNGNGDNGGTGGNGGGNACTQLTCSPGTSGDTYCQTQCGDEKAYCHDENKQCRIGKTQIPWEKVGLYAGIFVALMIALSMLGKKK